MSAPRYPALARWRAEMAAGTRTATDFDNLWRAAGAEQLALEHEQDGLPQLAASYHLDANRIMRRKSPAPRTGR